MTERDLFKEILLLLSNLDGEMSPFRGWNFKGRKYYRNINLLFIYFNSKIIYTRMATTNHVKQILEFTSDNFEIGFYY